MSLSTLKTTFLIQGETEMVETDENYAEFDLQRTTVDCNE